MTESHLPPIDRGLDAMISAAASHWDGADDHEWRASDGVLQEQVSLIYDVQHQPWHVGMFEPQVVKHWIESAIKNRALTLHEYLTLLAEREEAAATDGDLVS